jgi:predicted membrane protein
VRQEDLISVLDSSVCVCVCVFIYIYIYIYIYTQSMRTMWGRWHVCMQVYMYAYVYNTGQRATSGVIPQTMSTCLLRDGL